MKQQFNRIEINKHKNTENLTLAPSSWNAPKLRRIPTHNTRGTGKPNHGGESGTGTGLS